jgi:hypothetical protein
MGRFPKNSSGTTVRVAGEILFEHRIGNQGGNSGIASTLLFTQRACSLVA